MNATLEATKINACAGSRTVGHDGEGNTYYRSSCGRCGGQGVIQGYYYNQGGVCFACNGSGGLGFWVPQAEWEALEAKKEQARVKRQEAKARKQAREAQANLDAVLSQHGADLFEGLSDESPAFVRDIYGKAVRFGSISEAQANAVRKALAPKEAPAAPEALICVPAGRQQITGTILRFKSVESAFGRTLKMLVQCQGYKVFGTVPSGIEANEGDEVSFTATVEPKEPGFGFFSRPKA